jgi:hypothetical protein
MQDRNKYSNRLIGRGLLELLICLSAGLWIAPVSHAQALKDQAPAPQPPKTKLESFTGESGAVIIKGYTEVGSVRSLGSVTVSAMTFRNAKIGQESKGLSISVGEVGAYSRPSHAFIDYEEIAELVAGIDYISQADATVTKLANYEAIYSTKGGFKITVFNNSTGQNQVNVSTGTFGNGVFLKMQDLAKLRENIQTAKGILDNPDAAMAKRARAPSQSDTTTEATPSTAQVPPAPAAGAPTPKPKPKPKPASAGPLQLNNSQ